jgi:hypothetical protein
LSYRDANDGEHETERQRPQHVYPTPADPDLGHHANLGRQPAIQENAVVRRAQVRLDGIVRERNVVSASHTAHFIGSAKWLSTWPGMVGIAFQRWSPILTSLSKTRKQLVPE